MAIAKVYVDPSGAYLGQHDRRPRADAIEVPTSPLDGRATWNGRSWDEPALEPRLVPLGGVIFRALTSVDLSNVRQAYQAALAQLPPEQQAYAQQKLLQLSDGIYLNDPIARTILAQIGADPDFILGPEE